MPLPPPVGRTREWAQAYKAWLLDIARTYPEQWEILVGAYLQEVVRPRVVAGLGGAPLHEGSFWREWEPDVFSSAVRQLRPEMAPVPFSFPQGPDGEILESIAAQIMDGNEDVFHAAINVWAEWLFAFDRVALENLSYIERDCAASQNFVGSGTTS